MPKCKRKRARQLLPRIGWLPGPPLSTGSRQWFSRDGMLRIIASETIDGIELPRLWKLWRWKNDQWRKVCERRSRRVTEAIARRVAAEYESED